MQRGRVEGRVGVGSGPGSCGDQTLKKWLAARPKPETASKLFTDNLTGRVEIPGPVAITVGATYAGEIATTIRTGNHAHIFINNQLTRNLTIDPARRSQPLYLRPGRPT